MNSEGRAVAVERWVIYSTFDAEGEAAPFAEAQLSAYGELGFKILTVDTSAHLTEARAAAWTRLSTQWLVRPNVGYDFGSYRMGLTVLVEQLGLPLERLDLLLTNDSCYGPYTPLGDVFKKFDAMPRDGRRVFGMTDSEERGHHLQSYWLYFRSDVSHLVAAFFATAPEITDRQSAVTHGELGLSRFMIDKGCSITAFLPVQRVVRHFAEFRGALLSFLELGIRWKLDRPRYTRRGDKACLNLLLRRPFLCNQTIAFGTHMHFQSMTPFVKRELVRANPDHDPLIPWEPPLDARDNAVIHRWLRSSPRYRRRYGR